MQAIDRVERHRRGRPDVAINEPDIERGQRPRPRAGRHPPRTLFGGAPLPRRFVDHGIDDLLLRSTIHSPSYSSDYRLNRLLWGIPSSLGQVGQDVMNDILSDQFPYKWEYEWE